MSQLHAKRPLAKPAPRAVDQRAKRATRDAQYRAGSAEARARDGHRCRLCGDHRNIETHHVRPRSLVGKAQRDTVANLLTLCSACHLDVTQKVIKLYAHDEAAGANGFLRVEKWHQPKDQPGEYRTVQERA